MSTSGELRDAFASAVAGDVILLSAGTYRFEAALWTSNDGTADEPITVTSADATTAKLDFDSLEGMVINNRFWIIEKIWINGACAEPGNCEAGLGVKPDAHNLILRESRLSNWIQHVKGARSPDAEVEDASILNCELWNDRIHWAGGTPLDLVGGKRWRIVGNYIHDYGGDDNGDYGIFLKGGTDDGIVERNLVICEQDRPGGGATVGISIGGGGTGAEFCENRDCSCEDNGSIIRNNIVLHCNDTGLHSRRGCGSKFYNNIVYDTAAGLQIQVDSDGAPLEIRNNVLSGEIYGGTNYVASDNLLNVPPAVFRAAYADPDSADFTDGPDTSGLRDLGAPLAEVPADYCGRTRGGHDFGAIEFPAACRTWPWSGAGEMTFPAVDGGVRPDVGSDPVVQPDASTVPITTTDAGTTGGGGGAAVSRRDDVRGGCRCAAPSQVPPSSLLLAGLAAAFAVRARSRRRG